QRVDEDADGTAGGAHVLDLPAGEPIVNCAAADPDQLTRLHDGDGFSFHLAVCLRGCVSVGCRRGFREEVGKTFCQSFDAKSNDPAPPAKPVIAARPIASTASSVLAPTCGVPMNVGSCRRSQSSGGSAANTSAAAPARRFSRSASAS